MAKSTLSYGALLTRFKSAEKELKKEKLVSLLQKQESSIQSRIIGQLKNLLKSSQIKHRSCILGHKLCLIDHKKYNIINPRKQYLPCYGLSKESESKAVVSPWNTELSFIKKLTRRTDALQSKYGFPAVSRQSENDEFIHSELISIWTNALFFKDDTKVVNAMNCTKIKSCKFNRVPRLRHVPLLYYPAKSRKKKEMLMPQPLQPKLTKSLCSSQADSSCDSESCSSLGYDESSTAESDNGGESVSSLGDGDQTSIEGLNYLKNEFAEPSFTLNEFKQEPNMNADDDEMQVSGSLSAPLATPELLEHCIETALMDEQAQVETSSDNFIYDDFEPMQYYDEEEAYHQEALEAAIAAAEEVLNIHGEVADTFEVDCLDANDFACEEDGGWYDYWVESYDCEE